MLSIPCRLIAEFCSRLSCQVGGGIRTVESARSVLAAGAHRVILGSSLVRDGAVDTYFAVAMGNEFGVERLVAALDSRGGRVAIHGWKTVTEIKPAEMMRTLEPYCSAFLYTHIDTEGIAALVLAPERYRGCGARGRRLHRWRAGQWASGQAA